MTPSDTAPQRIADLEILRPLAEGGMAEVLLARDPATGDRVVLKVPRRTESTSLSPETRLRRESEILRRLDHPHLVRLRDEIITERGLILVLGHVDGTTLRHVMKRKPDARRWRPLLEQIIGAVAHCHTDLGLIHRDIKPENILIDRDHSRAVLCDFGIALFVNQTRLTLPHHVLGTSPYLPPRLRRGESGPSMADDVYALAVIAVELVTGCAAGEGDLVAALELAEAIPQALRSLLQEILTETHTPRDAAVFFEAWNAAWRGETVTRPTRLLSTGERIRTMGFRQLREREPKPARREKSLKGAVLFSAATALTASAALAAILATRGGFDLGVSPIATSQAELSPAASIGPEVAPGAFSESSSPVSGPDAPPPPVVIEAPLSVPPPPPLQEMIMATEVSGRESEPPEPEIVTETIQPPAGEWVVISESQPRVEIARSRPRPATSSAPARVEQSPAPAPEVEAPSPTPPERTPEERLRDALSLARQGQTEEALTALRALDRQGHLPEAWRSQLMLLERASD